ncbi:CNH domain-containing protein [Lipomyces kononenkoae]|uniref:CNH domain-containing protein n=1 Tax=Lipomyces kononenkoae TaxID=34357 RepID=A0ACC3SXF7_LIPKO
MVEQSDSVRSAVSPLPGPPDSDYFPFPARPSVNAQSAQLPPVSVPSSTLRLLPAQQAHQLSEVSSRKSSQTSLHQSYIQHQQASVQQQITKHQARLALQPRTPAQHYLQSHNSTNLAATSQANGSSPSPKRSSANDALKSAATPTTPTSSANKSQDRDRTPSGSLNGRPAPSTHVPSLPVSSYSFSHPHAPSHSTIVMASRGKPLVYPALLSAVAEAFVERLQAGDRVKDGLTYKNSFTGAEGVDLLMYILQTPDRTLALLLGRALDAMKLFHDVTYVHKLRDHQDEVYQLRDAPELDNHLASAAISELEYDEDEYFDEEDTEEDSERRPSTATSIPPSSPATPASITADASKQAKTLTAGINGIFMLMTECYSPTCTRSQVCYAVHCPKRLEQQFRVKELHPASSSAATAAASTTSEIAKISATTGALRRQNSTGSLNTEENEKENKLWIYSVPKEIADSVDEHEKMRQEVICEVIYTERDFVKDLEYVRDFWIIPLRKSNIIPEHRREKFIRTVFSNIMEVHAVNSRLAEALTKRQLHAHVVKQIGDIMSEHVPRFSPFIKYGANQLYGKHEFEREKSTNLLFSKFVDDTERMKESRKLELNGYLTKPTTRLAKYPLLLEQVLKYTPADSPDKDSVAKVITLIKDFLTKLNIETGKANNRIDLMQLSRSLVFPPGEYVDLKLTEEGRQILFQGSLKRRLQDPQADVSVYLLDHCLLFVRRKVVNRREQCKVFRKPIPLELLIVSQSEEGAKRPSSSLIPTTRSAPSRSEGANNKHPITFTHLGRRGYELTLYAPTFVSRKKWVESIAVQQRVLRERAGIYVKTILCTGFFDSSNRVNCAVPFDGGRKMLYGTDNGVYMSDTRPSRGLSRIPRPQKVVPVSNITQLEVLEEYSMLLALSDKTLLYWPLDTFETDGGNNSSAGNGAGSASVGAAARRPKKVATHINFFKSGISLGRVLVCTVKTNAMTTTVRALEPEEPHSRGKKQTAFRRLLQGQSEGLKVFKDFYVPSEAISLSFLKSKVCVGCAKGFEIVSLETLDTQSLLDPADTSLDFVMHKEGLKPIAIYRIESDFLLNYSDFSFYVNRNGWRSRPDWMIYWEGLPQSFVFCFPYIIAFEPSFIEIRHVGSGALVHIITGENIRFLHESTKEILYVYEDDNGVDVVAWLNFWESALGKSAYGQPENGVTDGHGVQRLDD